MRSISQRSNITEKFAVRVVLFFFFGNLDLRKCKFLTYFLLLKSGADFVQFSPCLLPSFPGFDKTKTFYTI